MGISLNPIEYRYSLYLNKEIVESSKADIEPIFSFDLSELPQDRLDDLTKATGEAWSVEGGSVTSPSFPQGITGKAIVTGTRTLTGKSDDLFRSHGFFVRVRGRLINEDDALFGLKPQSYKYFNRFRADIEADDLDQVLTAPREGVEDSKLEELIQSLLLQVFRYARSKRTAWEKNKESTKTKTEPHRNYVTPSMVEYPVADVLVSQPSDEPQSDADHGWFYLDLSDIEDRDAIIEALYKESVSDEDGPRRQYAYKYAERAESSRLVSFDPSASHFVINTKHEFVREHYEGDGSSNPLLEDIVTAEALLEVYMRENGVPASIVGEVLERRDILLRTLALDRPYSLHSLSKELRDATSDQYDLEIALVSAARRLGFIAKHISGPGKPDGIARFNDYSNGREVRIILEAKSSGEVPNLSSLDYAGLAEHMIREWGDEYEGSADGCLLVAPSYPGMTRGDESAASWRAEHLGISCWTVSQLADFVEAAERKHLTARDLIDVVLDCFAPDEVTDAISELLNGREGIGADVYRAIIDELALLEGRAPGKVRTIDLLLGRLIDRDGHEELTEDRLRKAVIELASASQGAIILRDGKIILNTVVEEIKRRVAGLLGRPGPPRRPSTFRTDE